MSRKRAYLIKAFLVAFVTLTSACALAAVTRNALSSKITLVGSTPGGSPVKSMLAISPDKKIDFIRWDLTLNQTESGSKTYVLNASFGEGVPNTRDFKNGGEKIFIEGSFTVSKKQSAEIYELKNEKAATVISFIKLNENLFHLLTADNKLMVGNGGWSYTLSRKDLPANTSQAAFSLINFVPNETAEQVVYDGRTPCVEFAREYNLEVSGDCFKLKWRLTLYRDAKTKEPAGYRLQSVVMNGPRVAEGKWEVVKGTKTNPQAIIYRLNPDKSDTPISFLVGDENILFFLDKKNRLITGDSEFSFTLNRRNMEKSVSSNN